MTNIQIIHIPLNLSTSFGRILYGLSMTSMKYTGRAVEAMPRLMRGIQGEWKTAMMTNKQVHAMTHATGTINHTCTHTQERGK